MSPPRNFGTMVQDLLDRAQRPAGSHSTQAKRAICGAVEQLEVEHLSLLEGRFSVLLSAGVARYRPGDGISIGPPATTGVPENMGRILDNLFLLPEGSATSETVIERGTVDELETLVPGGHLFADDFAGTASRSRPSMFAWYGNELLLAPVPDSSTHIVRGRYSRADGFPYATYASGAWSFFKPSGSAMSDNYPTGAEVNAWFTDYYHLVLQLSLWIMGKDFVNDDRIAAAGAEGFRKELEKAKRKGSHLQHPRRVRMYWPGAQL